MKTILITGANRGLGAELAKALEGNTLILASRKATGDLRNPDTIKYLADRAEALDIDILINNAGVRFERLLENFPDSEINEIIDVNLIAPIMLTKAVWPIFKKKKKGLIININSMAGKSGARAESIYCASKFGLRGFSEAMQYEATEHGIKIVNVNIGAMKTDMARGKEGYIKSIEPKEAAEAILNICHNYETLRITEIDILRSNY